MFPDSEDMAYMWPGMFVPPNDREGTIESTSRARFALGTHVESCDPDIPLIRYFEDGS